jgi:dTDP-4-amino-4,6-dideoxygalactose transaminase
MIVTDDAALSERLMVMRSHGSATRYYHKFVGGNFRLDPIQAAILLVKLPHLNAWSEARRQNAAYYTARLEGTSVATPAISPDCISIYNQYVIRIRNRDRVMECLKARNIGCEIYYPVPMHEQECFASLGYKPSDFPECHAAAQEVLAIPVYPELTRELQDEVVDAIFSALS